MWKLKRQVVNNTIYIINSLRLNNPALARTHDAQVEQYVA